MAISGFPTSSDIYLEVNGKKVAVVQSYSVKTTRSSSVVEAFGEDQPVATVQGPAQYVLELTRIYATDQAISDGLNFHDLNNFSLVICKPDRKTIYSNCHWRAIQETAALGAMVLEKVTVVAAKRLDVDA